MSIRIREQYELTTQHQSILEPRVVAALAFVKDDFIVGSAFGDRPGAHQICLAEFFAGFCPDISFPGRLGFSRRLGFFRQTHVAAGFPNESRKALMWFLYFQLDRASQSRCHAMHDKGFSDFRAGRIQLMEAIEMFSQGRSAFDTSMQSAEVYKRTSFGMARRDPGNRRFPNGGR